MVKNIAGINTVDLNHIDFSIMPSLECNLHCSFCMYDCSPENHLTLDYERTKTFLEKVNWSNISACGFYGGEPSINMPLYNKFIKLLPGDLPKFVITNGSWSRKSNSTILKFLNWCADNNFHVVVSGTQEHKKYQWTSLLKNLAERPSSGMTLKGDDDIHPMGRARKDIWECSQKCLWHDQPIRAAIYPTGDIIFQNCDGVYPVIGTLDDGFEAIFETAKHIRLETCGKKFKTVNDLTARRSH